MLISGGIPVGGNLEGFQVAQRIYGPGEQRRYNRPGRYGDGIVQPEVFMAPYPAKPGEIPEYFPLGNPAAGYWFESNNLGNSGNLAGLVSNNISPASFGFQRKTVY